MKYATHIFRTGWYLVQKSKVNFAALSVLKLFVFFLSGLIPLFVCMFLQKEQTRIQQALTITLQRKSKNVISTDVKTRIEMLNNDPPPQKKD